MEIKTTTLFICGKCGQQYSNKDDALNCEIKDTKRSNLENSTVFELTQQHLDLLRETSISWDDCEFGAPCIDCKRPYGNSDVETDIADIIKLPKKGNWDSTEEMWNEKAQEKLAEIHKETQIALQIILHCQTFETGKYKLLKNGWQKWVLKSE